MRVGVDGRSLDPAGGRGVAGYTRGMLAALVAAAPDVQWRVSLPRGTALPPALAAAPGVVALRHRFPSRLLHGAGAVAGGPRLDRLLGGVDAMWLPAPVPVAVGRDVPVVLSLHDLAFVERPGDFTPYERLWHRLGRLGALARRAARVAAVTEATARAATRAWRLDPARVAVVPAGPGDPGPALSPERAAAVRARLGLQRPYFLFVGALEPRKGLDVLLGAHAHARAEGLEAELVLAGDGRLAGRLGGPGVRLAGRVDDETKAALYAGARAVVLPSWLEGYGYPPLEGFAHGVPAIVSDVPALRETAGSGALHVAAGDERAWAAALARMAGDEALRRELAAAGAAGLAERSWAGCAGGLLRLLRDVAG
jgi:glycosyltransferase involved in cell wall biosynthesis